MSGRLCTVCGVQETENPWARMCRKCRKIAERRDQKKWRDKNRDYWRNKKH